MRKSQRHPGNEERERTDPAGFREPYVSTADVDVDADDPVPPQNRPVPKNRRPREFGPGQWFILWLVITLGVAAGHLLSNLVTSLAVAHQMRAVMGDLTESFELASSEAEKAAAQGQAEARERRQESARGESLGRQCGDWRKAHQQMNTRTTRKNMEKYCGAYREYVDTGRFPLD